MTCYPCYITSKADFKKIPTLMFMKQFKNAFYDIIIFVHVAL